MHDKIIIQSITGSDVSWLTAVALEAWQHIYRAIVDQQFIENFVNRNYTLDAILSLFPRLEAGTLFFDVAQHESRLIGFCNIGIHGQLAELYRIYLLAAYTGQGIGKRFYLHSSFQHCPEKNHDSEWYMEKTIPFHE